METESKLAALIRQTNRDAADDLYIPGKLWEKPGHPSQDQRIGERPTTRITLVVDTGERKD